MTNEIAPEYNTEQEQKLYKSTINLIDEIMQYFIDNNPEINESITVPITIVSRMLRTHKAIKVLLESKYPSEAAVLLLTQFELFWDLAYTSRDSKNATAWMDHEDKKWQVLSVSKKIDCIHEKYGDPETPKFIFRSLSGIKHGNPVYSELGFSSRRTGNKITITTSIHMDEFEKNFSEGIHKYTMFLLSSASQTINMHIAKYAIIDQDLTDSIQKMFELVFLPYEDEFKEFLKSTIDATKGHFDIKGSKEKR